MDRLFLSGLVDELALALAGARVRGIALDRGEKTLVLTTSLPPPGELVFSWNREAPGLFRFEWPSGGASSPGLKRWLTGTEVVSIEMSELDRIATLTLARKRLSGKREVVALVIEVFATRSAVYVVEAERGTIVEVLAAGASRLGPGERYEAPPPPPGAAPLAEGDAELRRRLEALVPEGREGAPSKSVLLAASGATPLVVRELRFRMEERGESAPAVYAEVRRELSEKRPWLYASEETSGRVLLAPLRLESETSLERPMPSFSEAAAEALRHELLLRRKGAARQRVKGAVGRALDKTGRLGDKLENELGALESPETLRGRGERLLAGLSQARRAREGFVTIPDHFDPDAKEIDVPIDPRRGLVENAERMFVLARRSERARRSIEERLAVLARERAYWEEMELALEDAGELEELEALAREVQPEDAPKSRVVEARDRPAGPRRFRTASGRAILAGRSGRSNDEVTFRIARPEDLWFHAAGLPGAHVVLKLEPGQEPAERDVEEAAGVAAWFSKARQSARVEVMVTERKNVSKIKGSPPGTVRLKSHRTLRVPPALPRADEEG